MRGDRISKLPDELIHHIFSFLPSTLAVQTSILSTRWRSLWAASPHLRFDTEDFSDPKKLCLFVEAILLFRDKSAEIKTFRLHSGHVPAHTKNWMLYALQHNIEELDLSLSLSIGEDDEPRSTFTCASLRVLKLQWMSLDSITNVVLGKLTTLHLRYVGSTGSSLSKLVDGCPNLENLLLEVCTFEELHASDCTKLKTLSLTASTIYWYNAEALYSIRVRAPHLASLKLGIDRLHIPPKDIPSGFSKILEEFCQMEVLELTGYAVEHIHKDIASSRVLPTFRNLKRLKMDAVLSNGRHIVTIISLLNSSPELEALVIKDTGYSPWRRPQKLRDIKWELSIAHLKSIKIDGLRSERLANKFLMFLLSNAKVLKQMVIVPAQPVC